MTSTRGAKFSTWIYGHTLNGQQTDIQQTDGHPENTTMWGSLRLAPISQSSCWHLRWGEQCPPSPCTHMSITLHPNMILGWVNPPPPPPPPPPPLPSPPPPPTPHPTPSRHLCMDNPLWTKGWVSYCWLFGWSKVLCCLVVDMKFLECEHNVSCEPICCLVTDMFFFCLQYLTQCE